MSLFDECLAIQATGKSAPAQSTKTAMIDMAKAKPIMDTLCKAYPALKVNRPAIEKSLKAPTGEGNVVVAALNMRNPNGGATLYYNGKLVLTGVCTEYEPKTK